MRTAFFEALCERAAARDNVWLLTADLGYSVLETFAERFPRRFINVGIAEQNMIGMAAGLALSGNTVVVYSIVNFATLRCLEQIRNDLCHHAADVKIVAVGAGFAYGQQGHTHHGLEDLTAVGALPGIDVLAPADPVEARQAALAVLSRPGPAYVRLGKAGEPTVHRATAAFARGSVIPIRPGADAAILAMGGVVVEALAAADAWALRTGKQAAVWSAPWLRPFDDAAVRAIARQVPLLVTVEEAVVTGGLGATVALQLAALHGQRARHVACAVPAALGPSNISQAAARKHYGIDAVGILRALEQPAV